MLTRSSTNNIRKTNTTPEWADQPDHFTHMTHSSDTNLKREETMHVETPTSLHSIPTEHRYLRSSNSSSSSGGFGSSTSNSSRSSPQPSREQRIMEPREFDDLIDGKHFLSSADEVDEDTEHDPGSSSSSDTSSTIRPSKRRKKTAPASRPNKRTASSNRPKQSAKSKSTSNNSDINLPPITLSIDPQDLKLKRILGEGQMGMVMLAEYQSVPVACKSRRAKRNKQTFEDAITRELAFAARLSVCPYMNPCIGILRCKQARGGRLIRGDDLYIVQRYYENGDLRDYMEKLQGNK